MKRDSSLSVVGGWKTIFWIFRDFLFSLTALRKVWKLITRQYWLVDRVFISLLTQLFTRFLHFSPRTRCFAVWLFFSFCVVDIMQIRADSEIVKVQGLDGVKFIIEENALDNGIRNEANKCYCRNGELLHRLNRFWACGVIKEKFIINIDIPSANIYDVGAICLLAMDFFGNFLLIILLISQFLVESHTGNCLTEGLIDVTDCYYGFPIALSYPHFLDGDAMLNENITGCSPNRTQHESSFIVNPVSLQMHIL